MFYISTYPYFFSFETKEEVSLPLFKAKIIIWDLGPRPSLSFPSCPHPIKDLFLFLLATEYQLKNFSKTISYPKIEQKCYCHPTFPQSTWYHIPFP